MNDAHSPPRYEGEVESPLLRRVLEVIRTEKDPDFAFLAPRPIPWTPLRAPLSETRVALLTTGGLHLVDDAPFRADEESLGDTSFRVVPHGTPRTGLALDASSVDRKYACHDPEVALPMDALERLAGRGIAGAPSPRHYGLCAGIVHPYPGLRESAGAIEVLLREDGVGGAVLLPTCSLCVQSTSILAHELEARGFSTVVLTPLPELTAIVGAPRSLAVRFPFGAPCGNPGNALLHEAVLHEALGLLRDATEAGTARTTVHAWRRRPAG